jgi:hypothetical protein
MTFYLRKMGVNVPSKSKKQKIVEKNLQDPEPDQLVRGTDPRIQGRIRTKCPGSTTLMESFGNSGNLQTG